MEQGFTALTDPRARWKSVIRKHPWVSRGMQWLFDPAFTPHHLIRRWVRQQQGCVLNVGSGSRFLGHHVVNLDIEESAHVHVINRLEQIPFKDGSFEGVLLEYVLEHVGPYENLIREAVRVLKPGGSLLLTVPFRQSYHGCPRDFWRFTHEGMELLLERSGLNNIQVEVHAGPTSAWIDATKEFLSTLLSFGSPFFYGILSQVLILPFVPFRYLDVVLRKSPVARYTAFSFRMTAVKPGVPSAMNGRVSLHDKIERALWLPEGCSVKRVDGRWWIERYR